MACFKRLFTLRSNFSNWSLPNKVAPRLTKQFVADFKDFYSNLVESTISRTKYIHSDELKSHVKKLSEYYTLTKFPLQGESFILAYELLEKSENITERMKNQAFTMACFMETSQAYFIIADDMCDGGKTRNNMVCWHELPGVGITAVNDMSILRSFTNEYLRLNIDRNIYMDVVNVINEQYLRLELGQRMDMVTAKSNSFDDFTMEHYNLREFHKSCYYCLITPIRLALILSNNASEESFNIVEDVCRDLGAMVQLHNEYTEYLDLTEGLSGKSCTDIQERKCTWLAVKALELCNPEQRRVFEENYGSYDGNKVEKIKKLYDDLGLKKLYAQEAQFRYNNYLQKVKNLPIDSVPSQFFFINFLELFKNYIDDLSRYYYV